MTSRDLFWFLGGVFVVTTVLICLLPGLLSELPALLNRRRRWATAGVVAGAVLAVILYLRLGSPVLLTSADGVAVQPSPRAHSDTTTGNDSATRASSMETVVASLEQRLAASGGSDGDWQLLAQSYDFLGRVDAAAAAREKRLLGPTVPEKPASNAATGAGGEDLASVRETYAQRARQGKMTADDWADYADVVASINGNSLVGESEGYIRKALALTPQHPKALWLLGSLYHQQLRYSDAANTWSKLLAVLDPASSEATLVSANLEEARRLAAVESGAASANSAKGGTTLRGQVLLADSLRSDVPAGLTLFILAKSLSQPGAPVAVMRTMTGTWPVSFELNDSMAMIAGHSLSTAGKVTVEARVSRSGLAATQPGDLLGTVGPLDPATSKDVRVVISRPAG